jgi:hypothetical protein
MLGLGICWGLIPSFVVMRRMLDKGNCGEGDNSKSHHSQKIVPQKYLTSNNYWGTVIDMANVLNTDKQIAVISALAEGSSIRSMEHYGGIHTIMRLG